MGDKPQRKRIVPEQILSPVKEPTIASPSAQMAILDQALDLRQQAKLAAEALGPGRKIYVELSDDPEKNIFNWNKILKDKGVKKPSKKEQQQQQNGDGPLALPGMGPSRYAATNPFIRVIQKLERAVGMANDAESDEDLSEHSDNDSAASEDGAGSGDEAEGTDKEGGRTGTEAEGGKAEGGKEGEGKGPKNEYDYTDPFFDDREFIDMIEKSDKRKAKHQGFYISKGTIERTDEMMAGFENAAPKKRKNAAANGDGTDANGNAKPKKKRGGDDGGQPSAKKMAVSGGAAATKATKPPPAPVAPYIAPADVIAAIANVRKIAHEAPPPPTAGPGEKAPPKRLPQTVVDALKEAEPIFLREHNAHKPASSKWILEELMNFLHPYSTQTNLRLYVSGRPKPKKAPTLDALRDLITSTVKPVPLSEAEDDFIKPSQYDAAGNLIPNESNQGPPPRAAGQRWKDIPLATRRDIFRYVQSQLQNGVSLTTPAGVGMMQSVLTLFPPGSMEMLDLTRMVEHMQEQEEKTKNKAAAPVVAQQQPVPVVQQQQQQQQVAPPPPEGLAAMIVQQMQQQQARQTTPQPTLPPPAVAAPPPAAPSLTPEQAIQALLAAQTTGGTMDANMVNALMTTLTNTPGAAVVAATLASKQPTPAAASGPPTAAPSPSVPTAPPAAEAAAAQGEATTDDEILKKAVAHGASESDIQAILAISGSAYLRKLLRVLAAEGPSGCTVGELASKAVDMGIADWNPRENTVRSGLSRQTHHDRVAFIGKFKYTLKCFPGVVDQPRPGASRKGKDAGSAVSEAGGTDGGGKETSATN